MRTKALLLAAVFGVAGLATSFAQVYSVNAVGYVNVDIPATGWKMICNPLDAGDGMNTISQLVPVAPEGTIVYKFAAGAYETANVFEFGEWSNPAQTIMPGEGVFVKSAGAATITFVGEVPQQADSNKAIAAGFNMTGSVVPQAGLLTTDLGYPADEGDAVYQWNGTTGAWNTAAVYEFGEWSVEPQLAVGEAVFIKAAGARAWNRNFSVN
jgi:hypothetical protein